MAVLAAAIRYKESRVEKDTNMADISGVRITDLTACGASDDGEHIWITHRLGDGTEYPLVYPFEAVGYLITVLADAARSAQQRRVARNPREREEGADTEVIPVDAARVGTSPDNSAALLHLTTADQVPIAVELKPELLRELIEQLQRVADNIASPRSQRLLH
jgi:hypothetical protein